MFKVLLSNGRWVYNIPPEEAIVYREEGYIPIRM